MKRLLIVLMSGALLIPLSAAAKTMKSVPTFKQADTNGDHFVSIKEAVAAGIPKSIAKKNDLNGDGKLTTTDWILVRYDVENHKMSHSSHANNG